VRSGNVGQVTSQSWGGINDSTVPAGGSTTFSLTLEEDSAGSFADRVIITSNDPGEDHRVFGQR